MCDSPHAYTEDPLLEELRAAEEEVKDLSAVLFRAIRRRDDMRRLVQLGRLH